MSNFGALTDHFSIATSDLVLVDSSLAPVAKSVERAQNEEGDNVAQATHGQNSGGDLSEASCTYALKSGTLNLAALQCGELESGVIASGIEVGTENGAWPQIAVSGMINAEDVCVPDGKANTYTLPAITISGCKRAQLLDFTIGAGGRLTSSSLSASIDVETQANGTGTIVAHGISGGVLTVQAEQVRITDAPTFTKGGTWDEVQAPGASGNQPQATHHTFEFSQEKILERDDAES